MSSTAFTTSLRLTLPGVGDPTTSSQWGGLLNGDFGLLESAITGATQVDLTGVAAHTLSAINGQADEARSFAISFTGVPVAGGVIVTLPPVVKFGIVSNQTANPITLTTGAGGLATSMILPPDGEWHWCYCDGANVASILEHTSQGSGQVQNRAPLTGTGVWTAPNNVGTTIRVSMWGGGAGGGTGGASGSGGGGGGGGGGGFAEFLLPVTSGEGFGYTVGAGGGPGSNGGYSSFGGVSIYGGSAGQIGNAAVGFLGQGGAGGAQFGSSYPAGALTILGTTGDPGYVIPGTLYIGGHGGAAPRGGSGGAQTGATYPVNGTGGGQPGGGGGGGCNTAPGGYGGNGLIIVEW